MDLELEGKAAIVTGGSRGIGKAVARELALEGVDVAIVARGREALGETAAELAAETGRRIVPITADTGDDAAVRSMVKCAAESLGRVDILVNNAARPLGQAAEPSLSEFTDDHFWADMNVKTMGYVRCAREVFPHMRGARLGADHKHQRPWLQERRVAHRRDAQRRHRGHDQEPGGRALGSTA